MGWISRKQAVEALGISNNDLMPYVKRNKVAFVKKGDETVFHAEGIAELAERLRAKRNVIEIDSLTPDMITSLEIMELWGCSTQNLKTRYEKAGIKPIGVYLKKRHMLVFSRDDVVRVTPGVLERKEKNRSVKRVIEKPKQGKRFPLAELFLKDKAAYMRVHNRRVKGV